MRSRVLFRAAAGLLEVLEFIAAGDELLHIRWSGTSRAAQYEAHGLQLELVLGAHAGRAFGYSKLYSVLVHSKI